MSDSARDVVVRELLAHRTRIWSFLLSLTGDPHAAEDLLQEVALVLMNNAGQFEPGTNFYAWALTVARLKVLEYGRSARQARLLDEETYERLAEAHARISQPGHDESEARHALRQCLGGLPARSRRMIALRYEDGLAVPRIARVIRSTTEAVQKALSRMRRTLRECVERRLGRAQV